MSERVTPEDDRADDDPALDAPTRDRLLADPALILHDREGDKHTAQADAILRGEASLGW